jgi:hypothetical protein
VLCHSLQSRSIGYFGQQNLSTQYFYLAMKSVFLTLALLLFWITQQAFCPPSVKAAETVTLIAGTPVVCSVAENFTSDEKEEGNVVKMIVEDDVVADGQFVIRKNAIAEGRVLKLSRANNCRSCPDQKHRVEIELLTAKAVDGQKIALNCRTILVRGKCPKCPAEVNTTLRIEGYVQSNTRIVVR